MSDDPREPQLPLDYQRRGTRRSQVRGVIVALIGTVIALIGIIVFFSAHAVSIPGSGVNLEDQLLHELLWALFGIALVLGGTLIAAVGLSAWCRSHSG